jgi:hypothetical protein
VRAFGENVGGEREIAGRERKAEKDSAGADAAFSHKHTHTHRPVSLAGINGIFHSDACLSLDTGGVRPPNSTPCSGGVHTETWRGHVTPTSSTLAYRQHVACAFSER